MKQYFIGFFTAVCLVTSTFLFIASSNNKFQDLEVRTNTVTNSDSNIKTTIRGGSITLYNNRNEAKGVFGLNEKSGYIHLINHNNYKVFRRGSLYGEGHSGDRYLT